MGRLGRWIALVGIAVVTLAVTAAPAGSRPRRGPVATIACPEVKPGVCKERGKVTLAPNSYGSQSTDTVPAAAKTADVSLVPEAPGDDLPFDQLWFAIVDEIPNLGKVKSKVVQRFITCNLWAYAATFAELDGHDLQVPLQTFNNAYTASLYVCLAVAFSQAHASAAAARPCQADVRVPIQISRSGSRYQVQAHGQTSRPRHKPPLVVSCRRRGNGLVISLRARRRGGRLRPLLGPHLTIGYANRGSRAVHFRTAYRFSR
jgi:hypothetical protein